MNFSLTIQEIETLRCYQRNVIETKEYVKVTQRVGILPDIEVKPTRKGIREGRDELMENAIEYIMKD